MSGTKQIPIPDPLKPSGAISKIPIPDVLKPAAPDNAADGDFASTGPVWWVGLNNDQTHALTGVLAVGGGTLALLTGPLWPAVGAAIEAASGYIELINSLGGSHGVDINGVLGVEGVLVTPRVGKIYGELIQGVRYVVSGETIMDFIVRASAGVPALAAALGVPVVASIFSAVASGTPLGWAIAGGVGLVVNLFESAPDPNAHGSVMADRDQAQQWESFFMGQLGNDNKVSLLSWVGLFSAQNGGGQGVYANRLKVGDWETWTLIANSDGTVSFQTHDGHFLCAEQGGGQECQANRTSIGTWEKFYLVNLPDGKIALKTHDKGKFVSVQA
jgi:hypothetical protein